MCEASVVFERRFQLLEISPTRVLVHPYCARLHVKSVHRLHEEARLRAEFEV